MLAFLGCREDFSNSLMPLSSSCRHHQPLPSYYAKDQQKRRELESTTCVHRYEGSLGYHLAALSWCSSSLGLKPRQQRQSIMTTEAELYVRTDWRQRSSVA